MVIFDIEKSDGLDNYCFEIIDDNSEYKVYFKKIDLRVLKKEVDKYLEAQK